MTLKMVYLPDGLLVETDTFFSRPMIDLCVRIVDHRWYFSLLFFSHNMNKPYIGTNTFEVRHLYAYSLQQTIAYRSSCSLLEPVSLLE